MFVTVKLLQDNYFILFDFNVSVSIVASFQAFRAPFVLLFSSVTRVEFYSLLTIAKIREWIEDLFDTMWNFLKMRYKWKMLNQCSVK